ncbi:hypothetical protein CYMTET_22007, partial [Cymbomonas tetramitiformis]
SEVHWQVQRRGPESHPFCQELGAQRRRGRSAPRVRAPLCNAGLVRGVLAHPAHAGGAHEGAGLPHLPYLRACTAVPGGLTPLCAERQAHGGSIWERLAQIECSGM